MPKKHRNTLFTKPQSTAPSSFSSSKQALRKEDAGPSSVNDLIKNLRRSTLSQNDRNNTLMPQPPTMHPLIKQILHIPDTPTPRSRIPRRLDANGQRLPSGPAPPRSWLSPAMSATDYLRIKPQERVHPACILHLPAVTRPQGLTHLTLKIIAKDWAFHSTYNMHYMATMPSHLRSLLLSYVAVYGPDEGIGLENLRNILRPPHPDEDFAGNEDMCRLDLSGALGRSISFLQLTELLSPKKLETGPEESWDIDDAIPKLYKNPTTFLPFLTHLSVSHPPPGISWAKLLELAKNVPTVTHLSLAHWPVPSLNPNSKMTTISTAQGLTMQYGGTNFYSHSLDDDWSEAAGILRRLSWSLYNLEWLNLDGNTEWAPALRWNERKSGVDWKEHWKKVKHISLKSCYDLSKFETSESDVSPKGMSDLGKCSVQLSASKDLDLYKEAILRAVEVETAIRRARGWIFVEHDDWERYDHLLINEDMQPNMHEWNEKMKKARFSRQHLDSKVQRRALTQGSWS